MCMTLSIKLNIHALSQGGSWLGSNHDYYIIHALLGDKNTTFFFQFVLTYLFVVSLSIVL